MSYRTALRRLGAVNRAAGLAADDAERAFVARLRRRAFLDLNRARAEALRGLA